MKFSFQINICVLLLVTVAESFGQDSTQKNMSISGYVEAYYSYDIANPSNHLRQPFFYNYNRHNEVALNLGFLKVAYENSTARGNFALMMGTYAQYNLASEPIVLRNVFEANAGIRLHKKINFWLDAGVLPSHIGFESAIGRDCLNLTRSILADNTPYYEAGARLSITTTNEKLYLAVLYLNGWQRIQRTPSNQTPAFGSQLTYTPKRNLTFNWSTYAGNDFPDSVAKWRYFNNFYSQLAIGKKTNVVAGFDIGFQQLSPKNHFYDSWLSPIVILQYKFNDAIKLAARAEYYRDDHEIIITTPTKNGFDTYGYSLNIDYSPAPSLVFRIEGRALQSKDSIFHRSTTPSNKNLFFTSSIALSF